MDRAGPVGPASDRGCAVCGLPLSAGRGCPNRWCHRADREFSVVFPLSVHLGAMRNAIARYKYQREVWLADVFATEVERFLGERSTWFEEFDVLTGVPAYLGAGAERDWDPVGRILARLADRALDLGWEVLPDALVKWAETPKMQGRPWGQRQTIAAGPLRRSLRVEARDRVEGARVLVLDDVMADGATLREVARCLRRAGAAEVAGLVLARRTWDPEPPRV